MNYGFEDDQIKSSGNPFPVSEKVDDVEITNCEYASGTTKDGKSWEAIDVTYTRAGTSIVDRMFAVNKDNISPRPWIVDDTVEAATAEAIKTYNTQLLHVATKLNLTKEDLKACDTKTFKTLATDYSKMIMKNCSGVKLYMKTVKDNGGYTKVGRNPSSTVPFLHRMGDGECTLKYTDKELARLDQTMPNGVSMKADATSSQWIPLHDNV